MYNFYLCILDFVFVHVPVCRKERITVIDCVRE